MSKPLALIHGGLMHGRVWEPFLKALNLDVDPILIELPGHGDAEEWDRTRNITDQAIEIATAAMPRHAVPLIGHSYGAAVALRLAVERPGRVSSLVLIEPVFYAAVRGGYRYDKLLRDMTPIMKKAEAGQSYTAARQFMEMWGDGQGWDSLPQRVKTYAVDRIGHIMAGEPFLWEDPSGVLKPERIEELDIPVTLVEGAQSHPIVTEIVDALGRRMQDAEGITIPGANHMVPLTHPMPVAEAVRDRLIW